MEYLDLLLSLDEHYILLSDYEQQKIQLCDTYLNDEKNTTIVKLESNINVLQNKNKSSKDKLMKTEKLLKEYNFIIKEVEDKLYDGNISDLKQLELLSEEKNDIKNTINDTETKVIEYMLEVEETEKKLLDMRTRLENIIKKNQEKKLKYIEIDKELIININKEKKEIARIELDLDGDLLKKYRNIRSNKGRAIVEMKDGVCTGCNMSIATRKAEQVKANIDIIYCENCGRILCKQRL